MSSDMTYARYLQLDKVLSAQAPLSQTHDETLFIIIHQTKELWLKQVIAELRLAKGLVRNGSLIEAYKSLARVSRIQAVMTLSWDVLATMTPSDYTNFRAVLGPSSGFQSDQFRQIEFVLGHKSAAVVSRFPEGSRARLSLERRLQSATLWDAFVGLMARQGYLVPAAVLARDVTGPVTPDEALQAELVRMYRSDPGMAALAERLVDLDEGLQEWRYRHVKMVQRTIGMRPGTGGSSGAGYLQSTLMTPLFPDLWAIRTQL